MKYLCIIAIFMSLTNAWFGTGHLLVSRIAEQILSEKAPAKLAATLDILKKLKTTDPKWTSKEDKHPFTECATFADDIKHKGGSYQSGWHFIDAPYLDEGGKISDFDFTKDEHNITEVINALTMWFNKADGYKDTYEYKTIMSHTYNDHTEANGASTAMRLLIHYCGDIHQPLHATTRVDHEHTKGDRGGNDFPLPNMEGIKELHAVWDSVLFEFNGWATLPYTEDAWRSHTANATRLMNKWTVDETEAANLDPVHWAQESFEFSEKFVYPKAHENVKLTDDYIKQGNEIAEKRIVLAGHRLANLIMSFPFAKEEVAFLQ